MFSSPSYAEVFYCSPDEVTGFDPGENYKIGSYKGKRFKIKVDFKKESMTSEVIWLKGNIKCLSDQVNDTLYCISTYGSSLAINRKTLKFHLAMLFLEKEQRRDDITLGHGTCEKF